MWFMKSRYDMLMTKQDKKDTMNFYGSFELDFC